MFRLIKSKHGKCTGIAVKTQGHQETTYTLQAHTHTHTYTCPLAEWALYCSYLMDSSAENL